MEGEAGRVCLFWKIPEPAANDWVPGPVISLILYQGYILSLDRREDGEGRGEKKGPVPKGWRVLCAHPTLGPAKELQPLWSRSPSTAVTLLSWRTEALQPQEFLTLGERTTPCAVR